MTDTPGPPSAGGTNGATTGDPAALIGAAVAAAIAILVEPGTYTLGTTALGLTLLLLLHVYDRENSLARPQLVAFGAVWALCMILTLGVLLEWTCPEFLCKTPGRIERVVAYNREFFFPFKTTHGSQTKSCLGVRLLAGSGVSGSRKPARRSKRQKLEQLRPRRPWVESEAGWSQCQDHEMANLK
jgi:hypothetical protein